MKMNKIWRHELFVSSSLQLANRSHDDRHRLHYAKLLHKLHSEVLDGFNPPKNSHIHVISKESIGIGTIPFLPDFLYGKAAVNSSNLKPNSLPRAHLEGHVLVLREPKKPHPDPG